VVIIHSQKETGPQSVCDVISFKNMYQMLYNICPETHCFSTDTTPSNWATSFLQLWCYLSRCSRALLGVFKALSVQENAIVQYSYTHDEVCDMLLTLATCNSQASHHAPEFVQYTILIGSFKTLLCSAILAMCVGRQASHLRHR
jgi:hypothetical protein